MNAYLEERVIKAIKDFYKEDKVKEFDYWNPTEEMIKDFEKNWIQVYFTWPPLDDWIFRWFIKCSNSVLNEINEEKSKYQSVWVFTKDVTDLTMISRFKKANPAEEKKFEDIPIFEYAI